MENSRYFIIEGRSRNSEYLENDVFIDDVEIREHKTDSLRCGWVINPGLYKFLCSTL